jgi:hypothetical protein
MLDRIRETVALYLAGRISANELPARLPDGWETDQAGDEHAARLVLRILGYLAEFQNGTLSESDLRMRLMPFGGWTRAPVISPAPNGTAVLSEREAPSQTFGVGRRSQEVPG